MCLLARYKLIALLILLFAGLMSCKKEEGIAADMGYRYFPDHPGHWLTYRVDSIHWDDFTGSVDTFSYQIKEVTESVFTDEQGRPTLRIERYKRQSDTSQWVIKDVWFANRTASTAERVEENVRYLKLIFPPEKGAKWDGNLLNTAEELECRYLWVHDPYSLEGLAYDSALAVLLSDRQTLISRDYRYEVYACGVGLVYKKFVQIETELTGVIKNGYDYSYTLLGWGDN
jgi:hypothetical protein